ncbi:glycerophosphodiester phosphodiesterase family protein [Paenibacillus sp. J2TS4]|uniref:glycerophosphodiester phosphodiesterase family protein n=1 Tax=Paenibacillus sp. J2TS4 TaxID=2807194 RepID=UPI001B1418D3|nr:glycerophosphodiester phosphodiesterase family protein [Paenibacillus sp. J2TS4]GIP36667.1 hypothetical protein J2TS4_58770 [Paenibacillus sp. J2TS4]
MKERYNFTADYELPYHPTYNPQENPEVRTLLPSDWATGYLVLAQAGDDVFLMNANKQMVDYVPYIKNGKWNGVTYKAAPGITQHIQSLQRVYTTGDASIDFWPLEPTPGTYEFKDEEPRPFPGPVISNTLLITEVLYDAIHDEDTGEFIEFTNISDQRIDISGYSIGDSEFPKFTSSGEGMFKFPEGTYIDPFQVIVVAGNAQGIKDRYDVIPDFELEESMPEVPVLEKNTAWATGTVRLANAGDQALIYDREMQIIDAVVWKDPAPFPGVTPYQTTIYGNNGHSIERWNGVDTNNCAVDFVSQPEPSPGTLLFGPNADESRIPDRTLREDVLVAREPQTGIVVPPTVLANGGDAMNAPENTRAAMEKLLETEASQILLPVQETLDGKLILMKDQTLNRTTNGKGRVDKKRWDEIRNLDAGSWFSPEFAGQRVPLLSEALDFIKDDLIPVIQVDTPEAAVKIVILLDEKNMTDAHIVSTDEQIIANIRELNPELRGGLIYSGPLNKEQLKKIVIASRQSGATMVMLDPKQLTNEIIHYLRVRGLTVWSAGGQDEMEAHDLIALGVSGLVTENPQAAIASLGQYPENTITQRPIIGGHRGAMHQVPENTIPAFEEAWRAGADLVEADILETKDGHLILMHDDNVDRTTDGTGKVRDMTLAQLKELNANYVHPEDPVEVPTLEELLVWAKSKQKTREIALFLEIKAPHLEQKIMDLVQKHRLEQDVFIISFRLSELKTVRQLNKEIGLVYIHNGPAPTENPLGHADRFVRESLKANVHFNPSVSMTPEFVNFVKHRGLITFAWPFSTVADNPKEFSEFPISVDAPAKISLKVGQTNSLSGSIRYQSQSNKPATLMIRSLGDPSNLIAIGPNDQDITALGVGNTWVQAFYQFEFVDEQWTIFAPLTEITITN